MSDECTCGHVEDEHEDGFLRPCTVPDDMTTDGICPCIDFEASDE